MHPLIFSERDTCTVTFTTPRRTGRGKVGRELCTGIHIAPHFPTDSTAIGRSRIRTFRHKTARTTRERHFHLASNRVGFTDSNIEIIGRGNTHIAIRTVQLQCTFRNHRWLGNIGSEPIHRESIEHELEPVFTRKITIPFTLFDQSAYCPIGQNR